MPKEKDYSDYVDCRGDGGVLKKTLKVGNVHAGVAGDHNGLIAKCNYVAYIEGGWFDGRQVETTRDRAEEDGDYAFIIGDDNEAVMAGYVIKGLNAGVELMHRGEIAELIIKPEYAYGSAGKRSKPKVPPNATLRYEVELLTWKPALSEEPNMLDMSWQARFELAYSLKDSANEHFREGQPEEARERYWRIGMLMDVIGNPGTYVEMPADRVPEQDALATVAWLNEAMCFIRLAQNEEETGKNYKGHPTLSATNPTLWRKAIDSCDRALNYDKDSVKGLYRKGFAYLHLHEFENAKEQLLRAASLEPANREVRSALEACRTASAEAHKQDARMFQKVLRKSKGLYSEKHYDVATGGVAEVLKPNPLVWLAFRIGGKPQAERVVLELWADRLPKTAENFRQLCRGDKHVHALTRQALHYKSSPIHRVVRGMMVQGGDFVCHDGTGGESIYGAYFADEGFETKHTEAGLLCMANSGRDTNRSQFYITTAAAPHLDGRHVVFGRVLSGMATVEAIESMPVDAQTERPLLPIVIDDCGEKID